MKLPNNEFIPEQPGLINDPLILSNMSNARKGGYALNRNVLLAVGLFFLLFFTALAIYVRATPAGASFTHENYVFFRMLAYDNQDPQAQVSRLDAYYKDTHYYYDVTYTAGAGEQRRVYYGAGGVGPNSFDPAVLSASKLLDDIHLFNSWQAAVNQGTHKSFDARTIQRFLDDVYN